MGSPVAASGGAFVGPGSEGSPGWSSPLSRASPTPVRAPGGLWGGDPLLRTGVQPPAKEEVDPVMGHHGSTDPCPPQTAVPHTGGWGSLWVQTPGPPAWDAAHTFSGHQGGRLHGAGNLPEGQVASPTSPGDFLRDCTRASPSCCCAHRAAPISGTVPGPSSLTAPRWTSSEKSHGCGWGGRGIPGAEPTQDKADPSGLMGGQETQVPEPGDVLCPLAAAYECPERVFPRGWGLHPPHTGPLGPQLTGL